MESFQRITWDNFIRSTVITTLNTAAGLATGYLSTISLDNSKNDLISAMSPFITPLYIFLGLGPVLKYSTISSLTHYMTIEDHLTANVISNLVFDIGMGLYNNNFGVTGLLLVTDCLDLALEYGINSYILS